MKTLVLYKSKTGYTGKYAQWIARELSADLLEATKIDSAVFCDYDTVIYGGGLYAVGINGIGLITKNLDKLKGKKVIVYATGASPLREDVISDVWNKNFTEEEKKVIRFFYLRGGFNFSKLSLMDKFLMMLMKAKIKSKKESERTPDEKGLLTAYGHPVDFTSSNKINELITYARS
jgi:menaquinone-dependent protoporphyrinogen IX oxidase